MADQERDPKVSGRYGELPREEPPAAIDAAILAAAKRAAQTRPAPLVPPTGRQRWYFPLAAAAVIMLAVAVTLQIEREQPDPESVAVTSPSTPPAPPAAANKPSPAPEARRKETPRKPLQQAAPKTEVRRQTEPQRAAPMAEIAAAKPAEPQAAAPSSTADALERREIARDRQEAAGAMAGSAARGPRSDVQARTLAKVESPEQALERIATLRRDGRHEEADQALKDFRKRYPDFKIPEEMLKRVEK